MSKYDGRLYTQAEFDEARYGTYANKSTDTSGLGEYSDGQLLKELVDRGVTTEIIGSPIHLPPIGYGHTLSGGVISGKEIEERAKLLNKLINEQHQRIKEIIG